MGRLSILLTLLATEAAAQGSPPSAASGPADVQASADEDRWYSLYRGKKFGLQLDAGVPDGTGLMVLFRPYWWLRANGGFAYNVLGVGIRGGVTVMPLHWAVTPTLNFDLGHYFSGDLTKFVTPSSEGERALYSDTAYDFWSGQIGLEFGSQDGFVFYVRGGITHLSASPSAQNLTRFLNESAPGHYLARRDLDFTALLPAVSLGILIYIF